MAISISFAGSTIYRPGSYSQSKVDLGGGFPLSPTGLIAIFGEAEAGTPGASEVNLGDNVFNANQLPQIKQKYGSGPIVDACSALFAPGADGAIPGGASAVYIYKTNASVRATFSPVVTNWGTLRAREWGTGGNKITYKNVLVPATSATATHGGTFDLTAAGTGTSTLVIRVNGSASYTWTSPSSAATDTLAELNVELANAANWAPSLPAGISLVASGTSAAAVLTISRSASGTPHKEGAGRNFQVVSGSLLTSFPIVAGLKVSSTEDQASVTISNKRDLVDESGVIGGDIVLTIGRNGGTAPQVTVNATQIKLINNAADEFVISKADFTTLSQVRDYINTLAGGFWTAALGSTLFGQLSPSVLDRVTAIGANGSSSILPAQLKRDASLMRAFFEQSSAVEQSAVGADSYAGMPDAQAEVFLSGGAKGATLSAEVATALSKIEKLRVNSVVPLFSRNASDDISDLLTDAGSTYTIDGIHQATRTHLSLMATIRKRSERQGYLSVKAAYTTCKQKAQDMADARIQMCIQDIKKADSNAVITWFQPWMGAALLAGARAGSTIGNPLTSKYFNMSGIRQTGQAMSTAEQDIIVSFDPDLQFDDAIQNGITFWERPQTGGFKLVLDNTTYGRDGNWVYNRAHVQYAADVLAFDFRSQMEAIFVGVKNVIKASDVKSTADTILSTYLTQGITVSTTDAPAGYKQLVCQINGNTINISVVVKLVEGIDFVLATILLQRAGSST